MAHLDDEQLSLLALGEDLGKDPAVHVIECRACAESLASLQRTVLVATSDPNTVQLQAPGSHNWAAIHATLRLSPSLAADPLSDAAGAGAGAKPDTSSETGTPTPLRPSSNKKQPGDRRGLWILGVAAGTAAGLVVGAWTAASILGPAEPPLTAPSTPAPTQTEPVAALLAEASLQPLASHTASGEAVVQSLADGSRQLVIRLPDEPQAGFREVWVGSSDLSRMVSLGVLGNQTGSFVLPSGLDLTQYPIVDISREPYDGDPAHSAESVARGVLTLRG